jgi:AcrR family transcriptional regulator
MLTNHMVKKVADDQNASRAKILDAARAEFSEKGFDGARVDEIAKRAEVNKALIYYYFKSKDELLQELLRNFLEERQLRRPKSVTDPNLPNLPSQVAQFDVQFLFERRDILRIVLMEDLKSSRGGIPGPGTLLKHWLEGLVEARENYNKAGYGFRYTPRVLTAMYFFHLMPLMAFCSMGETMANATGQELSSLREEFLKLLLEQNNHHFHSVFGDSCTDPTPEIALPGLDPRPPSEVLAHVGRAFREGELYDAAQAESILSGIAPEPGELFARLISLQCFKIETGGRFRWCVPNVERPPTRPSRTPPQDHLKMTSAERDALVAKCMPNGRLEKFPLKEKARLAVVEHISSLFQPNTFYTEKQVDALLKTVVDDHAKARRYLIDYRYLHRKPDGSAYWTWDSPPPENTPQ